MAKFYLKIVSALQHINYKEVNYLQRTNMKSITFNIKHITSKSSTQQNSRVQKQALEKTWMAG